MRPGRDPDEDDLLVDDAVDDEEHRPAERVTRAAGPRPAVSRGRSGGAEAGRLPPRPRRAPPRLLARGVARPSRLSPPIPSRSSAPGVRDDVAAGRYHGRTGAEHVSPVTSRTPPRDAAVRSSRSLHRRSTRPRPGSPRSPRTLESSHDTRRSGLVRGALAVRSALRRLPTRPRRAYGLADPLGVARPTAGKGRRAKFRK